MPLWTTYLANWTCNRDKIIEYLQAFDSSHGVTTKYVMRNRGNNEIAPLAATLLRWKLAENRFRANQISKEELEQAWNRYEKEYMAQLTPPMDDDNGAFDWIANVAHESAEKMHVILVCFEKDAAHCHRRLLAEHVKASWPEIVDYKGELPNSFLGNGALKDYLLVE